MRIPLFIIKGYSGSGKSTTAPQLRSILPDFDVFDMDVLVCNDNYQRACNHWIRVAYANAMEGRGTVLLGNVPDPYDIQLGAYTYFFHPIKYVYLHCQPHERIKRLKARGVWEDKDIERVIHLANQSHDDCLQSNPPIPIIDTTHTSVSKVAELIKAWILSIWTPYQ